MIQEEMKVGPKGQVVIPKAMRKTLKIGPGSKVIVRLNGEQVIIEKPLPSAVSVFEEIAKSGPSINFIEPHLYEEELEKRIKP
jgi:AbrB family looped-hinge helix DNA binding protein